MNGLITVAAIVVSAILGFHGLGNHIFSDDGANTALFARNMMKFGTRTAWDGRNLIGYAFGEELDENLTNIKIPPQQFYIAIAGMKLAGETTVGARWPFVVIGLAGIGLTAWWASRFIGAGVPFCLPAILIGLSPAYLLSIRTARYFAPGVFWAVLLFGLWTVAARAGKKGTHAIGAAPSLLRWQWILLCAGAVICVLGLFTSNDLLASTVLATLPVFFLEARFRRRSQFGLLALIYAVALPCGILALIRLNVWGELVIRRGAAEGPLWETFLILLWRHTRDMGTFEYFAWPMLLPLALPWIVPRLRTEREIARRGLILGGVFLVSLVLISLVSPTRIDLTTYADMRFMLPLIAAGALISSVSLVILWRLQPVGAVAVGLILVLTNALYPGPRSFQHRIRDTDRLGIRSTLYDYVYENLHPFRSAYGNLADWLAKLPPDTTVRIIPFNAVYGPMFYVPDVLYCAQLSTSKPVRDDLAVSLPDYVYQELCKPDIILIHPSSAGSTALNKTMLRKVPGSEEVLEYENKGILRTHWPDGTSANIPFHYFYKPTPANENSGLLIYELKK